MAKDVKYTSTKSEIWKAYQEILTGANENTDTVTTTTGVAEQKKVDSAIKTAGAVDITKIEASVNGLVSQMTASLGEYGDIITAIKAKKVELKDILGIEVEANSLVALVATKDKLVAEKVEKALQIEADANAKADAIIAEAKESSAKTKVEIAEIKKLAKQDQSRQVSEWEYAFGRRKQQDVDALQDNLDGQVKVIVERETAVKVREDNAKALETSVTVAEKALADEITATDGKIADAVTKAKKGAETSANIAKAMDKKANEADMSIKDARIQTLEEKVAEQAIVIDRANQLAADANAQIISVANNALDNQKNTDSVTRLAEMQAQSNGKK